MPRVPLIEKRADATESQLDAYDHIVASRGSMLRPFALLLHRPEIAKATADLGAVLRYGSSLSDRVRELAICVTAIEWGCVFEWDVHSPMALAAGVGPETMRAVQTGTAVADSDDGIVVLFARQLVSESRVDEGTFEELRSLLGDEGAVELSAVVGYYSMMGVVMNAFEAC